MKVSDFDFDLPTELIAQSPAEEREAARLLLLDRVTGELAHYHVADLPDLLSPGDLLVVNDTRVFPARLLGYRVPSGGAVECLLLKRLDDEQWEVLMHPGQKLKVGARVRFEANGSALEAEVVARHFHGRRTIRLWSASDERVEVVVERIGHVPLPPYIRRPDADVDRERYQTVYATATGSVAAPTAGLHLTEPLLKRLARHGIETARVTLHVGYGTFQPIRGEQMEDHRVEAEPYEVPASTAEAVNLALSEGRRVIAVGTTSTRTLETAALAVDGRIQSGAGVSDLYLYPGASFRVLGGVLTNFHLPRSSLLLLVAAFAGRERVLHAYREAVRQGYRFYSYGDAMLVL